MFLVAPVLESVVLKMVLWDNCNVCGIWNLLNSDANMFKTTWWINLLSFLVVPVGESALLMMTLFKVVFENTLKYFY